MRVLRAIQSDSSDAWLTVANMVNKLQSENAAQVTRAEKADALVKKLVDALEELMDGFEIRGDAKLDALVSEGKAAK